MSTRLSRRHLLHSGLVAAVTLAAAPAAAAPETRRLRFLHTHTGESLAVAYFQAGSYDAAGLEQVAHLLRDHRSGDVHPIDPALLDLLHELQALTGRDDAFQVISGYRSPQTNRMLNARSSGVATRSLHMDGKAIDVRMAGVPTKKLHELAMSLKRGGVGYYAASDFVHVDTGRVRYW
ncbi:MAG: DUF882 domain-containing protein [Steroidobacteraceae bacterium]|nr:DUF882 domain-containing protein [Steroidobacteraceae bacterium]